MNNFSKFVLILWLSLVTVISKGQLSKKHYLPPFYGNITSSMHDARGYFTLYLSTNETTPFDVTIKRGDGTLITTINGLSVRNSVNYQLPTLIENFLQNSVTYKQPLFIKASDRGKVLSDKGIVLEGDHEFFVNVRIITRAQGASLTSKGLVGAGTHFFAGFMKSCFSPYNGNNSQFISIMATSNNTVVSIKNKNFNWFSRNQNDQSGWTLERASQNKYSRRLNKGETITLGYDNDQFRNASSRLPSNGVAFESPNGTEITATKPIVVNSGSWSASPSGLQARDIGFDQIVPVNVVGDQYILVKGQGNKSPNSSFDETKHGEAAVIIATKNNTVVTYHGNGGNSRTITLAKKGDAAFIDQELFDKYFESSVRGRRTIDGYRIWYNYRTGDIDPYEMLPSVYLESTKPIYVYQTITGVRDKDQTTGMSFIPPLKCTSDYKVTIPFARAFEADGSGRSYNGNNRSLNTVIKGSTSSRNITINGTALSNSSYTAVPGGSGWYSFSYQVPRNGHYVVENTQKDPINVALYGESGNVGAAGYFSGFGTRPITVPELSVDGAVENCGENTRIVVQNNQPGWTYNWYKNGEKIDGATSSSYTTNGSGYYSVEAGLNCNGRVSKTYPSDPIYLFPCINIDGLASATEGEQLDVNIVLSESVPFPVTYDLEIVSESGNGIATHGTDYKVIGSLTGITIPANTLLSTVSFDLMDDSIREPEEHFTVRITRSTMSKINIGTCVATIKENDNDLPKLSVDLQQDNWKDGIDEAGTEGKDITLSLKLSEKTGYFVSVDYEFIDITAKNGEDYNATPGTITFAPGELEKEIHLMVIDDNLYDIESKESFKLMLNNVSEAELSIDPKKEVFIVDDETKPSLAIKGSSVLTAREGDDIRVEYHLTTPLDSTFTVGYKTTTKAGSGYATANLDYTEVPLTDVQLLPGTTDGAITVSTLVDGLAEVQEKFMMQFRTSKIVDVTRFVDLSILDINAKPQLSFAVGSIEEGQVARVNVTLTTPLGSDLVLDINYIDGSAKAGQDYQILTRQITIPAGAAALGFDITTIEDTEEEGDEDFEIRFTTSNTLVEMPVDRLSVMINDNDSTPIARDDSYTINEGEGLVRSLGDNDFMGDLPSKGFTIVKSSFPVSQISFDKTTGQFSYTPPREFSGIDSLSYTIEDADGDVTPPAKVLVRVLEVDDIPVANDDLYTSKERTHPSYATLTENVLSNDVGLGDGVKVQLIEDVKHGTLVLNEDGSFTYNPDPQFFSSDDLVPSVPKDYFTYRIVDQKQATQTSVGKCQIEVAYYNDEAPILTNDRVSTNDKTPVEIDPLVNDNDIDGKNTIDVSSFAIESITGQATVVYEDNMLKITPKKGVDEVCVITYRVNDLGIDGQPSKRSLTGTVEVTISKLNQVPIAKCQKPADFHLTSTGDVEFNATMLDNGSSDSDGEALTYSMESVLWGSATSVTLDCGYVGTDIPVDLVVSDPKGATSRCSTTFTVVDPIDPILKGDAPSSQVYSVPKGVTSKVVSYTEPIFEDNCTTGIIPTRLEGKPSGSSFSIGTHSIRYKGVDAGGNSSAEVSFDIIIHELDPILSLTDPTIVLCEDESTSLELTIVGSIGDCTIELLLDGVVNNTVVFKKVNSTNYQADFVGLPKGLHDVAVRVTDDTGTVSYSNEISWNVKGRPASLKIQAN
ncbi:HYR domain-containing protein [Halosquirtibacter xylanolyticus]|uniref:Calx-beta domain-containing protein n=1 Tax=Halosquirtibacter xylanolyticus TaxID=3374599 RepID=UPI0037492088|nr:HYR domain-containing protein [Prolixibacteraceae bacterium]